jgi:hypothetical protein
VAAFVLWIELLIRAAAVYVAVLFLPLALATLVWPAVAHWCRRLVETLAALILSKFVIVATLSLAAGAVSSGTAGGGAHGAGFSAVLAGGALLVMATFVPFAILRLIPAVESGAVAHLDGLRARGTAAMTRLPRSAVGHVLNEGLGALGDARLLAQAGPAGRAANREAAPGGATPGTRSGEAEGSGSVGHAEGDPDAPRVYEDAVARGVVPARKGPKPILATASTNGAPGSGAPGNGVARHSPAGNGAPGHESVSAPTGPAAPEDAWKWEGVPPGRSLIGKVEAGQLRYYMGEDDHGPRIVSLPRAWPPGEGGDAG